MFASLVSKNTESLLKEMIFETFLARGETARTQQHSAEVFRGTGVSAIGELWSLPPAAACVPRNVRLADEWRLPYLAPIKVPLYTRLHRYCIGY